MPEMIVLIDNYDSFSYNLYQLIGEINSDIVVVRNDQTSVAAIRQMCPSHIVISPGPGRPADAGICIDLLRQIRDIPILGVCLGHQAICEAFGATVSYAKELMHGKSSRITIRNEGIFAGLPENISVARYHSLAVLPETLPESLHVTALTDDGEVMAVQHRDFPIYGVQFHPESILTEHGRTILKNFFEVKSMSAQTELQIKEAIIKLGAKEDLSADMAEMVMDEIMSGRASQLQIGAYLVALSMKGETIDEITASARGMRKHAVKLLHDLDVLEIVGTGGDKSNSINISTCAALILAAAGVPVAKHGNRAASSKCGAADVLEALGVNITVSPEKSRQMLEKIGICFLFAQNYHLAMKYVAPVRKELAVRSIFNILGPLSNPAGASMQLMGVYNEALVEPLAEVLLRLGVKKAMVVYGQDGLDEISPSAPTSVCEIRNGWFKNYIINPEDFGFKLCGKDDITGGSPAENAAILRKILNGEKSPRRDAVVLNAAAAFYIAQEGISMKEAIQKIETIIDSGMALAKLHEFIAVSNEV